MLLVADPNAVRGCEVREQRVDRGVQEIWISAARRPILAIDHASYHHRSVEVVGYERWHLGGIVALCLDEGWPSFPEDPERAHRALTAPGVTAVVAVEGRAVLGFGSLQSDGEIQAHLSNIVVARSHRRTGVARRLLQNGIERSGGVRIDLVTDTAESFYEALHHKRWNGYRIYPPFT